MKSASYLCLIWADFVGCDPADPLGAGWCLDVLARVKHVEWFCRINRWFHASTFSFLKMVELRSAQYDNRVLIRPDAAALIEQFSFNEVAQFIEFRDASQFAFWNITQHKLE